MSVKYLILFWLFFWLGNLDSNQDKQSQSLLCYRYTIPQYFIITSISYAGRQLSRMRRLKTRER